MTEPVIDQTGSAGPERALGPFRSGLSRRRFLGSGMVGMAAVGTMATLPALGTYLTEDIPDTQAVTNDATEADSEAAGPFDSVVAHVRDIRNGLIDLHINGTTINIRNPQLAQSIARSAH